MFGRDRKKRGLSESAYQKRFGTPMRDMARRISEAGPGHLLDRNRYTVISGGICRRRGIPLLRTVTFHRFSGSTAFESKPPAVEVAVCETMSLLTQTTVSPGATVSTSV